MPTRITREIRADLVKTEADQMGISKERKTAAKVVSFLSAYAAIVLGSSIATGAIIGGITANPIIGLIAGGICFVATTVLTPVIYGTAKLVAAYIKQKNARVLRQEEEAEALRNFSKEIRLEIGKFLPIEKAAAMTAVTKASIGENEKIEFGLSSVDEFVEIWNNYTRDSRYRVRIKDFKETIDKLRHSLNSEKENALYHRNHNMSLIYSVYKPPYRSYAFDTFKTNELCASSSFDTADKFIAAVMDRGFDIDQYNKAENAVRDAIRKSKLATKSCYDFLSLL